MMFGMTAAMGMIKAAVLRVRTMTAPQSEYSHHRINPKHPIFC